MKRLVTLFALTLMFGAGYRAADAKAVVFAKNDKDVDRVEKAIEKPAEKAKPAPKPKPPKPKAR